MTITFEDGPDTDFVEATYSLTNDCTLLLDFDGDTYAFVLVDDEWVDSSCVPDFSCLNCLPTGSAGAWSERVGHPSAETSQGFCIVLTPSECSVPCEIDLAGECFTDNFGDEVSFLEDGLVTITFEDGPDTDFVEATYSLTNDCTLLLDFDGDTYAFVLVDDEWVDSSCVPDFSCLNCLPTGSAGAWSERVGHPSAETSQGFCIVLTPSECSVPCETCDTELTWNQELSDYNVECVEDLPMTCEDFTTGLMAINECDGAEYEAVCTPLLSLDNQEVSSGVATTAKRDESLGEDEYDFSDAAIRLYGLSASGIADSDYFVEDPSAPLSWNYYPESGTATLTGRVYCRENSARWFDLNAAFEDALNAQDWMDLDSDNTLLVNTDPNNPGATCDYDAENMTVFLMQPGSSYLLADGELNELNGLIGLDHMPLSLNKRFQYGPQANNHNCGYGLGGWFRWDGVLNGEEVSGMSGDIVVDIEESSNDASCSESACFDYTALDFDCGQALTERFCVNREDTTPPLISEGPLDVTVECDAVPEMAGTDAIVATDNCSGDLSYAEGTELRIDGDCPSNYVLIRKWDVTDACGLTSTWTQNVQVRDTSSPALTSEAVGETLECDGEGNLQQLSEWIDSNGGAEAVDNCGMVSWSNDYSLCDGDDGSFNSYKQQNWGGNSTVASDLMDANFDAVFPDGVAVGCDDLSLRFTSSEAVDTYLPCTGSAEDLVLTHSGDNPTENAIDPTCWNNALVSHLLTAKLNVAFDNALEDFSPSSISFGDLLVASGAFEGKSVDEVIQISDEVLGNCSNDFTPSQCRSILRDINKNFSPSENDRGDLIIPGCWTAACGSTGMAIVTFTAEDECGNSSSSTATFTIVDTTSPEILAESSIMVDCEAYSAEDSYGSYAEDCGMGSLTWVDALVSGGCIVPVGAYLRTYTATDDCGNTSTAEQIITLVDDVAPVIDMEAADETIECDGMGNLTALNAWLDSNGGASAIDNCSNIEWSNDYVALNDDCGATGSVTVIFTATDDCDNASSTAATFTIEDTTAPDMTEASDQTVECDGMGNMDALNAWLDSYGGATASDICSGVTWSSDYEGLSDGCGATGSATVTFTATDDCGNASSTTATFTIEDTTNPAITAASDQTVECDGMGNMDALNGWLDNNGGATASDVCSGVTWSNDFEGLSDDCGATGSSTVTFTATDDCGNASSVSATFTIEDTTDPVFEPFMSTIMVECTDGNYSSPDYQPLTATDDCSGVEYDIQSVCMSGGCLWTVMRIWTATDDCGNSTTVEQFIMLIDTTAPVVTAPAPYNVDADADDCSADISATADVAGFATVHDNCGDEDCWGMESITVWSEDAELEAICGYGMDDQGSRSIVRTWYAQDRCGNIGQDTQIITISDVTPPVASVTDESVACADYDPTMEYGMTTSSDNCSAQTSHTWAYTETIEGDCAGSYMVKRTYTFEDDCGNTSDVVQTISVFDDVAPVISGENQVDVECSSDYATTVYITASDACGSGAEISFTDVPVSGGCVQPVGMYQRMYSVTDDCGNVATFEQFVRLLDTTAPELTIPEDYTIECDQDIVYDDASATDNCDGDVAIDLVTEIIQGDCPKSYQIKRTWTATDDCDNPAEATQTITVQDTTPPELTIPDDYTAECSEMHPLEDASATDNCGEAFIVMSADTVAGDCTQSYVVTRTFMASDECGNETTLSQTITIQDTTAPSFNEDLPMDMTVECDNVPLASVLTATDNCQDVEVVYSSEENAGDCMGRYTIVRTWTVADDCGNDNAHTQTLTVQDTTAPELTIPSDYTAECSEEHPLEDASATDNCGTYEIVAVADTVYGTCASNYVVTRTFTATDDCGNEASEAQVITIQDTTDPVILAEDEVEIACGDYDATVAHASTTDNCGEVTLTWGEDQVSGGCVLPIGQYVRIYTATDECGNSSIFEQILTLTDDVDPEFTFVPEGATYECFEEIEYLDATATDNCSGATVTVAADTVFSDDCMQTFTITRTFTATDNCGNDATATQVIEVQDTEGPDFTFVPDDYTAECSDALTLADAAAIDHCSMVDIQVITTEIPGTCEGHYTILREFVATDDCGNHASQTQVITIQDTTAPEFTMVPEDYTAECSEDHPLDAATASDNCSEASIVVVADTVFSCTNSYVVTRKFTATDACGNVDHVEQVITIEDTTAPVILAPADYTAECTDELIYDEATVSDNCGTPMMEMLVDTTFTECDQEYVITRTWMAMDECNNESEATQTITVLDTTAPVITSAGGLMNGQVVEVCCESLEGGITVPEAVELSFSDNCDAGATMEYNEECIGGNCPTADVESWCEVSNPAVMPDGETCDNYSVHSLRLFNFPGSEFYTTIEGRVANNVDGTKTYTMTVVSSDNANAGWEITNNYGAPMSWDEWLAQPGSQSYKSDCGLGDHTEWMYTTLTSGSATGWGDYEGSSLTFNHQPASGYFGFQIGEGANNKNGNYGFSAWMYYNGTFGGSPVSGSGDVFGDLDCCLPYDLSRSYVVTDCAGNDTDFAYTVRMTGEDCDAGDAGDVSDSEDSDFVHVKDLVKIASLQPNPTSDMSVLVLTTEEPSLQVEVTVMTMTGSTVMTLFNGPVVAGWPTTIEVPAFQLESGMYQVKARAKTYVTTKKLLVAN